MISIGNRDVCVEVGDPDEIYDTIAWVGGGFISGHLRNAHRGRGRSLRGHQSIDRWKRKILARITSAGIAWETSYSGSGT